MKLHHSFEWQWVTLIKISFMQVTDHQSNVLSMLRHVRPNFRNYAKCHKNQQEMQATHSMQQKTILHQKKGILLLNITVSSTS